jgi:hypothetical protein
VVVASPEHADADIDAALASWRQGDCVLGVHWFLGRAAPACPLTDQSRDGCDAETGNYEGEVPGFAVLSQTCDLVRRCDQRPFVEVAPLIHLDDEEWRSAHRGRQPRFAILPALAERRMAADLDRVMTVEKAVVATWERVHGWHTDDEARAFALALARKRSRAAFPDDFVDVVRPLQNRIVEKHDKQSDEGRALRSLREIRVRAAPAWDACTVEVDFLFIRDEGAADFEGKAWVELLAQWLKRVPPSGRFHRIDGVVQTLDDLTARDYVESDPLDLGFLSDRPA